jgi:hypothetical protein
MKSAKTWAIVALAFVLGLTACVSRSVTPSVLPTPVSIIPTAIPQLTLTWTPIPSLTWTATASLIPIQTPTTIPTAQTIPIPTYDPSLFDVWVEAPLFCSPPHLAAQLWFESAKWELKDSVPPPHQMLVHQEIQNCHISQSNCGHGLGPDCNVEHDFFYGYSIYGSPKTWITCQGELRYINYCMGGEGEFDACFAVGCQIEDEIERTTCIQDAEDVLRTLQPVPSPLNFTLSPVGEGE